MARVLRTGGRVDVSELDLLRPLPDEILAMAEMWIGCVAGAVLVDETVEMARAAGLRDVKTEVKPDYVDAMTSADDPLYARIMAALPENERPADYITSMDIQAWK